jgi:hypothetical protein
MFSNYRHPRSKPELRSQYRPGQAGRAERALAWRLEQLEPGPLVAPQLRELLAVAQVYQQESLEVACARTQP